MTTPNIILYGIGGASDCYRVFKYWLVPEDQLSIKELLYRACMMAECYPSIRQVYAIDNSRRLCWDFKQLIKHPSLEDNVIFKSVLENRGLLVYEKKKRLSLE